MRTMTRLIVPAGLAFLAVGFLTAQQPGGGFGGGRGGITDPLALLRNQQVMKELGITEEQTAKIPDALYKALGDVLDAKQVKRLRQIELQQRGTNALLEARLQGELKLSDKQANNIKSLIDDSRKELAEIKGGFGKGGTEATEKRAAIRKETDEKINGVLTADQRKAFKQILGDEFKLEFPKIDLKKFDFKKKKDADKKDVE